ncbi:hypothetical protein F5Y05DRAFT_285664 [Hypoxylon sp. FL0543]|nr:hypothetical protein F5Y05DRAFT_285664 [Hypoxylon sp. FL0543]
MAEPRYRYSGRRSPTFNPARASMPVSVGYNPHYSGDLHTVQTARYDAAAPRRANDHKASGSAANPTTTITTYNVTKDPAPRTSNTARRRSSTVDAAVKPIIVTTSHTRPHGSSSHATSSSAARQASPSRDPYRSSDETYYTQPASSLRGRSQHRYGHGYSQSATLSNDEFNRLRERVGDDRLRAPLHTTATDYYRYPLTHAAYTAPPSHDLGSAVIDYENEGYEYTKPSDLARYDLDHDRHQQQRRNRRDSVDRPNYYRPTVNVVSNDPSRYDTGRARGPPPTSVGLDRYNRAAATGLYDRPTVTMPALPPPVPAPPPVDPLRRIEAPRDPSPDRRTGRPRPVSLYQDAPARLSHTDDLYRSHDDERLHRRPTHRGDDYSIDDEVTARGFGIRTDSLKPEQPDRPARSVDRRDYDDRRVRREVGAADREPRRRSDESIDYTRSHDARKLAAVDDSKDAGLSRKNSLGGRAREKVATGLSVAAAAMGLVPKDAAKEDDRKISPRRRDAIDEEDEAPGVPRAADRYRTREKDVVERKPSPREEVAIERRESRRERADSTSASRDRELERERLRERAQERERERERGKDRDRHEVVDETDRERVRERAYERERERERDRDQREAEKERERDRDLDPRERARRDTEAILNGTAAVDSRDISPAASDGAASTSRRRRRNSSTFDPTDPRDLLDVKAELAAKDSQEKPKEKAAAKDSAADKALSASASHERLSEPREESRGREVTTTQEKEKTVRVLSPPRPEKPEPKPIKGILKPPSAKFPEEENPIREGVAPHKDDKTKKGVPPGARWTKVNRKLISPSALEGKERFEVRDDFVIVLRVLSKEEIQAYATATAQIRGMSTYKTTILTRRFPDYTNSSEEEGIREGIRLRLRPRPRPRPLR